MRAFERRLFLVDLAIGGVYVIAWLIFGWSIAVKNALSAISTADWFLVAGISFVFVAILYVIDLPLVVLLRLCAAASL